MSFDILANIKFQADLKGIANQIRTELGGIKPINVVTKATGNNLADVNVKLKGLLLNLQQIDPLAGSVAAKMEAIGKGFKTAAGGVKEFTAAGAKHVATTRQAVTEEKEHLTVLQQFGQQAALAAKRYTAFTLAIGVGYSVLRGSVSAIKEAVRFQGELVKIGQVSGKSVESLRPLSKTITELSTSLGVSSAGLTEASLTLVQAGLSARETEQALKALAKTQLAPTFGDAKETVEGFIATMAQFGTGADQLEKQFSQINTVAAKFAVESSDIITAIRRSGSAFAQLAKDTGKGEDAIAEFITLFSSVRATTRESAETIATGLRTIFTRLQRPTTIEYLRQFGVELQDLKGQFVGLFPAVQQIGQALENIPATDPRFSAVIEELGGFRQINKTIPLFKQLTLQQQILNVAKASSNSLDEDAVRSQEALSRQLEKVREEFLALFRSIGETETFQALAKSMIALAQGAAQLGNALIPLVPLLTAVAGVGLIKGASQFLPAFKGTLLSKTDFLTKYNKKAAGGYIGGAGETDNQLIAAMPGEFVINKKSAKALGPDTLHALNKYAKGGYIKGYATGGEIGAPEGGNNINLPVGNSRGAINTLNKIISEVTKTFRNFGLNLELTTKELKDSNGQFKGYASGKGIIALDPRKATGSTAVHEVAHAVDFAIGKVLGTKGYASNIEGSPVQKILSSPHAQQFKQKYIQSLGIDEDTFHQIASGKLNSNILPPKQAKAANNQELFARYISSLDKTGRQNAFNILGTYAQKAGPNLGTQPLSIAGLGLGGAHTAALVKKYGLDSADIALGGLGASKSYTASGNVSTNGSSQGPLGRIGSAFNQDGFFSGLGGGIGQIGTELKIPKGIAALKNRFAAANNSGFAQKVGGAFGTTGFQIGAVGTALVSSQVFGSASTNARGSRGTGQVGDVLGGAAGGAATGAFIGSGAGPLGTAVGGVVGGLTGLTFALIKSKEEIKNLDFDDALKDAVNLAQGGNFSGAINVANKALSPTDNSRLYTKGNYINSAGDYLRDKGFGLGDDAKGFERGVGYQDPARLKQLKEAGEALRPHAEKEIRAQAAKFGTSAEFFKSDKGKELYSQLVGDKKGNLGVLSASIGSTNADELFKQFTKSAVKGEESISYLSDGLDYAAHKLAEFDKNLGLASEVLGDLHQTVNLAVEGSFGRVGSAKINSQSDLLEDPSKKFLKQFNQESSSTLNKVGLGRLTGQTQLAGLISANANDIGYRVKTAKISEGNVGSLADDEVTKLINQFKKTNGLSIEAESNARSILKVAVAGIKGDDSASDVAKKIKGGFEDNLKPVAGINKKFAEAANQMIEVFEKTTQALNDTYKKEFEAGNLRSEAGNLGLKYRGITGFDSGPTAGFNRVTAQLLRGGGLGAGASPQEIVGQLAKLRGDREFSVANKDENGIISATTQMTSLTDALEHLSQTSNMLNGSIMKEIDILNSRKNERLGLAERYFLGNDREKAEITRGVSLSSSFARGELNIKDIENLSQKDRELFVQSGRGLNETLNFGGRNFNEQLNAGFEGQYSFANLPADQKAKLRGLEGQTQSNLADSAAAIEASVGYQRQNAGIAQQGAVTEFQAKVGTLSDFNNNFNITVKAFAESVAKIPQQITLEGRHTVEVIINGVEAFKTMEPTLAKFIEAKVDLSISNLNNKLRASKVPGF